jgi:transketolase
MLETTRTDPAGSTALRAVAGQPRVHPARAVAAAGSGHPSSAVSAADLVAVLLANHLRYDFERPEQPATTT